LVLLNLGNNYEAVKAFDAAIAFKSNDWDYHNNKGLALLKLGRVDEAVKAIEYAILLHPYFVYTTNDKTNTDVWPYFLRVLAD
jgi:Flp pilus assembly protein TadD